MAKFEKCSSRQSWRVAIQKIPTVPQKYEIAQNNKISLEYMQLFILLNESKSQINKHNVPGSMSVKEMDLLEATAARYHR